MILKPYKFSGFDRPTRSYHNWFISCYSRRGAIEIISLKCASLKGISNGVIRNVIYIHRISMTPSQSPWSFKIIR
ncbi:hypothetical protein Lal_00033061 [Lupinus albus]|nr:hypothetical protein Lal_00033061 [Lupinus albus]